jgi:hypothetical protein
VAVDLTFVDRHRRFHMRPVTTIAASRLVRASPRGVHAFLAELGNHWLLGDRHLRLEALQADGSGGSIRVRGPLGLGRRVHTTVTRVQAPTYLGGRAHIGAKTRTHVSWRIRAQGRDAVVQLTAVVVAVGVLDRLVLRLGGRRWLEAQFHDVLARLAAQLEPQRAVPAMAAGTAESPVSS